MNPQAFSRDSRRAGGLPTAPRCAIQRQT